MHLHLRLRNQILALLAALLVLYAVQTVAFALDVPDPARLGSISVSLRGSGGGMTIYRVAALQEADGQFRYVPTDAFSANGLPLEGLQSPELAAAYAAYAAVNGVPGSAAVAGPDGRVSFTGLTTGVYLLVQDIAAEGYTCAAPFLVTIPIQVDGTYRYDIDATPKMEQETTAPETTTPETTAPETTVPDTTVPAETTAEPPRTEPEPVTTEPQLPQTGQNTRPVPILAVSGMMLFAAGWVLRFGGQRDDHAE